MAGKRRGFTAEFKALVLRAALREDKTLAELAGQFEVHPNRITQWRRQVLEAMPDLWPPEAGRRQVGRGARGAAVPAGRTAPGRTGVVGEESSATWR